MNTKMFLGEDVATVDVVAMLYPDESECSLPMTFPVERCRVSQELLAGIRSRDDRAIDYIQVLIAAKSYRAIKTAQECMGANLDCIELAECYEILVIDRGASEVLATISYAELCRKLREFDLGF